MHVFMNQAVAFVLLYLWVLCFEKGIGVEEGDSEVLQATVNHTCQTLHQKKVSSLSNFALLFNCVNFSSFVCVCLFTFLLPTRCISVSDLIQRRWMASCDSELCLEELH
eukprot:m.111233 g.111233  ORF g.111233 m.111233 type:complete len:109 (-) comp12762_c1_seq9:247-573(-)